MKNKRWMVLFLATIIISLVIKIDSQTSAAPGNSPPEIAQKQQALNQTIQDLDNPDLLVRRNAGRLIARLADVPGIQRAILPLMMAASDPGQREGIVNRSIYVGALGTICRRLGSPVANNTVDFLAYHLLEDPSDFMRMSAAHTLGISINERALEPLEIAIATDLAPIVVGQAEVSLSRLKRELGIEEPVAMSSIGSPKTLFGNLFLSDELQEYIKTHFIIFGE